MKGRNILDRIGDLRLGTALLFIAALLCLAGGLIVDADRAFFGPLNFTRLHEWLLAQNASGILRAWWLVALFWVLALFGINTIACTTQRIISLVRQRKNSRASVSWHMFVPSIVHLLVLCVMAGHALSASLFVRVSMPLEAGSRLEFHGAHVEVLEAEQRHFPADSIFKGNLKDVSARVEVRDGGRAEIVLLSFLRPAVVRGTMYQLVMDPRALAKGMPHPPAAGLRAPERNKAPGCARNPLMLMAKRDPGAMLIFYSCALIIALMIWYYLELLFRRRKAPSPLKTNKRN